MKKDNSALVLLVFILLVSMILGVAFADNVEEMSEYEVFLRDYEKVLIEPDYTTVYENDSINFEIGFNEFSLNEKPFFIEFDKNVFELDLSNIKGVNGYIYKRYEVKENGNNIKYIFYYSKDKKTTWDKELIYGECCGDTEDANNNKTVDMSVLSGLKLNVKNAVSGETYKIKSGYLDSNDIDFVPITVIKKGNNSNTLNNLRIDSPTYASCNVKCKAVGIGSKYFYHSEGGYSSECVKVIFEDGTTKIISDTNGYDDLAIDFDYNTVYQNDEINLKVSKVYDANSYYLEYDEKNEKYLKYENGSYRVKPVYLLFENDVYDININDIKFQDNLFSLRKYEEVNNGNTEGLILYFELKDLNINLPIKNNELFFEIKLKTRNDAKIGTNYIDVGIFYEEKKDLIINTNYIEGYSPINIIKKENISKKLNSATFYYGCFGLTGEELFVDVTENSDTYSFVDANDDVFEYMNVICNQKCYVYENGNTFIENVDSFDIKLKYDDGEVKKYSFINKIKNKEKFISLVNNIGYKVVIIGKGTEENYKEYFDNIKNFIKLNNDKIGNNYDYYKYIYYNYEELNEYEKELFKKVNINFSNDIFPIIYIFNTSNDRGDVIYGDVDNDTLFTFISKLHDFKYISENDESEISTEKDNDITIDDENSNKFNFTKVICLVSGVVFIVILVIIIVMVIRKKKSKKNSVS